MQSSQVGNNSFSEQLDSLVQSIKNGDTQYARNEVMNLAALMPLSEIVMFQEMLIDYYPEDDAAELLRQLYPCLFEDAPANSCLRQILLQELNIQAVFPFRLERV